MPQRIDISHRTVIFIAVFILAVWIIYLIRDLLIVLFIAVILMSALTPLVNLFVKLKAPKALAIALTYIIIIALVGGILAGILPPLIEESSKFIINFPSLLSQLFAITNIDKSVLQSELTSISRNAFSITLTAFDNILTVIFLLVITFYLLLERENVEDHISAFFVGNENKTRRLMVKIEEKLGDWLRGQMFLSLIIGVLSYIGLTILNIPYALPLALFAGIMEIVPVIGPIVSAIPAIVLALTIAPLLGSAVTIMYFVIQQLENHLIVPQVMKRAVGLNPLLVILAIAVGSRLLGFGGALLAVPFAVVLQIIAADVIKTKNV